MGLSLALGVAPAWAGRRAAPAAQRPVGLWAEARGWVGELLAVAGRAPWGALMAAWGEEGPYIDPDGLRVTSPSGCAAGGEGCPGENAAADSGHGIDPNG